MKKTVYYISIIVALLLSTNVMAGPVSSQDAKQKAAAFLQKQAQQTKNARRAAALRAPQLAEAQAFGEALHVFNVGDDNGFVIVSGDDRTEEILGYVEGGSFDLNNMPDNMRFVLQMYADQIKSLGNSNVQRGPRREAKAPIEKLMTTKWDQSSSYRCMLLDDVDEAGEPDNLSYYKERILTGCVATAMAQVLYNEAKNYKAKHGSWPTFQTNEIPAYKPAEGSLTGHTLPALPPITFDWANMIDNYSTIVTNTITEEQEVAVGRLMQYCGRSVKMEYSDVSGALVIDVPPAMSQYLNMNPYVQSVDRAYFNSELARDVRKQLLKTIEDEGYTYVILPEDATPTGSSSIETREDGLKVSRQFREHREEIDGIIVSLPNFGFEIGIINAISDADLRVPVLVQACDDENDKVDLDSRRDAFCGKISVCNNLYQYGIPFTDTTLHTYSIYSELLAKDLRRFAAICRVVNGLRHCRIGQIGTRPLGFNTCRASEKLLQRYGITVVPVDLSEILSAAEKVADDDPRLLEKCQHIAHYAKVPENYREKLRLQAKFGVAVDAWIAANDVQAVAIQCWDSLEQNYGCAACVTMSMLSDKLIPAACETDGQTTYTASVTAENSLDHKTRSCIYNH